MTETPNYHAQMMNLPSGDPGLETSPEKAYKLGHRDALHQAAEIALSADAALEAQAAQIADFKTVMIAAAEEISAHWDAHCDAEGYGPSNLMHRLEQGIPSQYGYTAGAFAKLKAEKDVLAAQIAERDAQIEALRADALRYRWLRDKNDWYAEPRLDEADGTKWELVFYTPQRIEDPTDDDNLDAAVDAAISKTGPK